MLARILLRANQVYLYGDKTGYTCACLERAALKGDYDTQERKQRQPLCRTIAQPDYNYDGLQVYLCRV